MKRRTLAIQLLHAGRGAMLTTESGRLRYWSVSLATCFLTLTLSGLVLAFATYEGRDIRGAARAPRIMNDDRHGASVLWAWGTDDVEGRQHAVIYVEPLAPTAPLPPGLSRWPKPGEAVLSPALLEAGKQEGIRTRYGSTVGTVTEDGLESPEERLAYVRPRSTLLDATEMLPANGFGLPKSGITSPGESMFMPDFKTFAYGLLGFTLLPAVALVVIAVRTGSTARDQRMALFAAIGAGPMQRAIFTIGELLMPTLLGLGAAIAVCIPAFYTDVPFPLVDFTLSSMDVRRVTLWLFLAGCIACATVLATSVLLHPIRRPRPGATRPTQRLQRQRAWMPWLFPFAILFTVRGSELASDDLRLPTYSLGVFFVLATLPSVTAAVTGRAGAYLASFGARAGRPGMLIAGRRMSAQTRVTARFVSALSVSIILAGQINLWAGLLGENAATAMTSLDRIGTSLVTISPNTEGATERSRIKNFTGALPEDVQLLRLSKVDEGGTDTGSLVITGSCRALQAIHATCSPFKVSLPLRGRDPRITELIRWTAIDTNSAVFTQVHALDAGMPAPDGTPSMIAISASGGELSISGLRELARAKLGMKATAEPLGNSWLVGAKDLAASTSWVHLLGLLGCLATVVAFGFSACAEFLKFGREVAPLTVLTGSNALLGTISGWSLLFPAILASFIGSGVAFWLTTPITVAGRQQSSSDLYPILAVGAAGSATLLCLWAWRSTVRQAASWRPTVD